MIKMKAIQNKTLFILSVLFLTILIFIFSLHIFLYNPKFYDWQYKQNGIYETLGYTQTWSATEELWSYMHGKSLFYSNFFSSRDQIHMSDVRDIFYFLDKLLFISCVGFLLSLFFVFVFHRSDFKIFLTTLFRFTGLSILFFVGFFGLCALFFDQSFILFHKLFFSNNYWLLDPATDKLVVLYPESFFLTTFICIVSVALVIGVLLFTFGYYLKKKVH